jgi:mono/diheme cytochrome c family protein
MKVSNWRFVTVLLAAVLVTAAALGGIGYYFVHRELRDGFSARAEPTNVEAFVAKQVRMLAMAREAREVRNPLKPGTEVLSGAMEHWADHCAACHGNDGRGKTLIGKGLYPKPPDMTQAATQELTDGELYFIIRNGIRLTGMPAFAEEGASEPDNESWALVHFIRHLPDMTPDEIAEMKKMNPKSPSELAKEERLKRFLEGDDSPLPDNSHEHHH